MIRGSSLTDRLLVVTVYSEVVGQTVDDLAFLMEHDTDSFNRWDASQELASRAVLTMLGVLPKSGAAESFIAAATASLAAVADPETTEDLALIAATLTIPSENVLAEGKSGFIHATSSFCLVFWSLCLRECWVRMAAVKAQGVAVDPTAVHAARELLKNTIATANIEAMQQVYRAHRTDYSLPFELSTRAVGARKLCGMVLQYLCATSRAAATAEVCAEQLAAANNMTDELSGTSK